jgi:hypothetical protein
MSLPDNIEGIEAELGKHFRTYETRVDQVARFIFLKRVKPFCRERHWRFIAGNGTWAFFPPNERSLGADDIILGDKEWDEIRELLGHNPPGFPDNDLGSMMPDCIDYTYEEEP